MVRTHDETFEDTQCPPRGANVPEEPHLILALECERPTAGSARYSLAGCDEIILGRGSERKAVRTLEGRTRRLKVTAPDRRMSSAHGRVAWNGTHWMFEDTHSRNGSLINGVTAMRAQLNDGDILQLGHTLFILREALPTPPGTTEDVDTRDLVQRAPGLRTLVPAFAKELVALQKVARSDVSLLLLGETGTGKEVLAQAVHALSQRPGELVAVNCGAIPATLVESHLFGHVKGAFSGATRDELGFVRAAHDGTLFLDEIGELPKAAQTALLRVLQEQEVVPVGSTRRHQVNIRVIAATHRSLEELVQRGEFRSDLLARLGGLSFRLPPLRERSEDLGLLIADLLPRFPSVAGFEPALAQAMLAYDWPHNIRELEKVLSLTTVLAEGGTMESAHLPKQLLQASRELEDEGVQTPHSAEDETLRATLIAALERHQGNVSEVAREVGKARQQVHRWLRRFRIDPKLYRS